MSILLYCITLQAPASDLGPGVAGLPVLQCEQSGILALFSRSNSAESWTGASLKQSAREFHNVLHRAFAAHAIIPFRFPTLMRDQDELASHIRDNAAEYASPLKKFENSVQMDIAIASLQPHSAAPHTSGREYLRTRQKQSTDVQAIAKQIQELAGETARSWRDRMASNNFRLFALVDRACISAFHERLKQVSVPPNMSVRISGPWPVTEFLELKQR